MVHLSSQPLDAGQPVDAGASSAEAAPRTWTRWVGDNEPRPRSGPFARWPRTADAVLATVVAAASLIAASASRLGDDQDFSLSLVGDLPLPAYLILGGAAASLCWRRRHSIEVTGVAFAVLWLWAILDYGEAPAPIMMVGLYSVGRYAPRNRLTMAILATAFVTATITGAEDFGQQIELLGGVIFALLPWYVGRRVRNRGDYLVMLQDRATQLERERDAEARRAVADERSRIARELHDVVAHRVSMMTVQAGAAKTVARDNIDAAVEAMTDVEKAGRQALGELRHLLGVLRPDSPDHEGLGPQPGISGIAALVAQTTQTGVSVSLTIDAHIPNDLPAALDLSAYRIVQESLTNVVKHAGSNADVQVRLAMAANHLEIEITNTITRQASRLPSSGYGIAGMRERVHLLGGTLDAGPSAGNRFAVTARMPLEQEAQ